MKRAIIAENKASGEVTAFTIEEWENLERSGNAYRFKVVDDSELANIEPVEPVVMDIEFALIPWDEKLEEEGIKYDKRIKDPEKLREIYEKAMEEKDIAGEDEE